MSNTASTLIQSCIGLLRLHGSMYSSCSILGIVVGHGPGQYPKHMLKALGWVWAHLDVRRLLTLGPQSTGMYMHMAGCQNYGPFLGTLNIRGRIIIGIQKGTIILTTTHITQAGYLDT